MTPPMTRVPRSHRIPAPDGQVLHALEWDGAAPALFCLPGLVRTGGDFVALSLGAGAGRRMVAIDYPGRGASFRLPPHAALDRYGAEACVRDAIAIADALAIERAVLVGTSFGGLVAMGIALARPGMVAGVALNDIGPDIGAEGAAFVRRFVAHDPALPDLAACAAYLRAILPPLSLADDAAWAAMATLTYGPAADGRWRPLWDTRIAELLDRATPDLWPLFAALTPHPLLILRGALSNILSEATLEQMIAMRQGHAAFTTAATVPGVGHAPSLAEPEAAAAFGRFLDRIGGAG
ncbi:MAG: alpha/beta hydrolase [Rhodospirillales bacterium]|nr:alpha/beta hydrolase [Rhodospirillales bacterium]